MNEIIKVIVDKLPYGCEECRWMTWDGYCDLLKEALPDVGDERFSECPLVTHNQAFDWIFFEAKATDHIKEALINIARRRILLRESEDK